MRLHRTIAVICLIAAGVGCGRESSRRGAPIDKEAARLIGAMRTAYDEGDWVSALRLADSAAVRAPDVAVVPFTRGLILTKLQRYSAADSAYRLALEIDDRYPQVAYNLGHNAFLQRRFREALTHYRQEWDLVRAGDGPSTGRFGGVQREALPAISAQIGRTYDLLGMPDSARTFYETAIRLDSTYDVAHFWLSEHLVRRGLLDDALVHARRALLENPYELQYLYQVGSLLFQTGHAAEAVPLLRMVAQKWPGHEGAAYNLGRALQAIGREEEAAAVLGQVDERQRLQEQALQAQRALELHPDDPERWVTLAAFMLRSGYYDKAEEALTAAATLDPEDLSIRNDLANAALIRGDTLLALHRFHELLEVDSTFADAWLNVGIIYAIRGERDRARTAWKKVLQYKPDDPDATAYLAGLDMDS